MKFEFYQDDKGEWRWRLKDRNRIVSESIQGYGSESICRRAAVKIAILRGAPRPRYATRPATFGALRYAEKDGMLHSAAKSYGTKV